MRTRGFTLIEITVALAVTLTLIGLAVPVAFRAMEISEANETRSKLDAFEQGLLGFYRDHARFPSASEGLLALVEHPGTTEWRGPYVSVAGSPQATLLDSRGQPIEYEVTGLTATLVPRGFDDLSADVHAAPVVGDWTVRARAEIARLNDAAEEHRRLAGSYPAAVDDLIPSRLGADFASDPWGRAYVVDTGRQFFFSRGPDGSAGSADDIRAPGL